MAGVKLEFSQFGDFDEFEIYRSSAAMDVNSLPWPIATGIKTMVYFDNTVTFGDKYYYRVAAIRGAERQVSSEVSLTAKLFNILDNFALGEVGFLFDPSNFSSLYQDSAGTIPVTMDGQPVGMILDLSGNGNHAIQTNNLYRPALNKDENGHFSLSFNGFNQWLEIPSLNLSAADKISIFTGVYANTGTAMIAEFSPNAAVYKNAFYVVSGMDRFSQFNSLSHGSATASVDQNTGIDGVLPKLAIFTVTHDIAASISTSRINQVSGVDATGGKGDGNFGNYPLYIGCRNSNTLFFDGRIYSMMLRGVIGDSESIVNTENWHNARIGAY